MKRLLVAAVVISVCSLAWGAQPDFYNEVESVTWVVKDIDAVMSGWAALGFTDQLNLGQMTMPQVEYQGEVKDLAVKAGVGYLGGFAIRWVQPLGPRSAFDDFLDQHGEGVFALNHRVPTLEALQTEVDRLGKLGVEVLQRGVLQTSSGPVTYAYLNTYDEGGYRICLLHSPAPEDPGPRVVPLQMTDSQFAFVVRDLDGPSDFWEEVGLPKMEVTHGPLTDLMHRGQPGQFDQKLGWHRHGKVTYEWILPLKGPTVYEESLKAHGEGFHHFAFNVSDMDEAIKYFEGKGLECSQAGGWGEKGKAGSGRFAYFDTESLGGITIELLWNFRE